jgi:indole-3-glycerol phosphate synthase
MNILDEIIAHKRVEVEANLLKHPIRELERSPLFERKTISLKKAVQDKSKYGIIAEIKRKSPSKGIINPNVSVEDISQGYVSAGVSAISVLTDVNYFGGSNGDLKKVRSLNNCPILRKDFIVDEYQLFEAKAIGADAILLIAAALPAKKLQMLSDFALSLGLEVLLEVHNAKEIEDTRDVTCDLIGVNNRDLQTFKVSVDISKKLMEKLPKNVAAVSESGIEAPEVIHELRALGYSGFLIGQYFMQEPVPELACLNFIQRLRK